MKNIITLPFKRPGNDVFLIGETKAELGGSEYHSVIYNIDGGIPPRVNEEEIKQTWTFLFDLYKDDLVLANHDVNKGGFIITLAEMCFKNKLGVKINLKYCNSDNMRDDEFLFSESVGRFIIESDSKNRDKILSLAEKYNVKVKKIGVLISEPKLIIEGLKNKEISLDVNQLKERFDNTIPNLMEI